MPLVKNQFERLQKINERLNRWSGRPVPKDELLSLCNCSESTLKEDLKCLREEYGAQIEYDRRQKGYHYLEPFDLAASVSLSDRDLAALETAVSTLSQLSHLDPFGDLRGVVDKLERAVRFRFLKPVQAGGQFLQVESVPYFRGGELIGPILRAISRQQEIRFEHQRFDADQARLHRLVPYLVKEHRNRWYVVGWQLELNEIRVYGLDRIVPESLQLSDEDKEVPVFDGNEYFRHSLGVAVYLDQEPEEVVLSFTSQQGRYFRTLPFFPFSQEAILVDTASEFRVRLRIIVNKELVYELARLGAGVKVLAPQHLAQQVKEYLLAAASQYGADPTGDTINE